MDVDRRLTIPYRVLLYCPNIVGKALELHVCKLSKEWSQKKKKSSHDTGTSTWYDDVEECRPSRDNQGIPSIYGRFSGCSGVTFHFWKVKAREGGGSTDMLKLPILTYLSELEGRPPLGLVTLGSYL